MTSPAEWCGYAAAGAGFVGDALVIAVAIAGAESSWNPDAKPVDNPRGWSGPDCHSYGLWQINVCPGRDDANANRGQIVDDLNDILVNARAAFAISGGGTNWQPWRNTWGNGNGPYLRYMDEARQAVNNLNPQNVERYRTAERDPGLPKGGGLWEKATDAAGNVIADPTGAAEGIYEGGKAAADKLNPIDEVLAALRQIGRILLAFTNPKTWLRVLLAWLGAVLVVLGFVIIARDVTTSVVADALGS